MSPMTFTWLSSIYINRWRNKCNIRNKLFV